MSVQRPRVLVVDDEEMVRSNLVLFLEDEGCDVLSASDACAALGLLREHLIDVAVVDMRLPDTDGNALIEQAHRIQPSARFLIHTGSTNYSLPPALRRLGVRSRHVFQKPLADMHPMLQAIRDLLDDGGDGPSEVTE